MTNLRIERNGENFSFYDNGLLIGTITSGAETAYVRKELERLYKQEIALQATNARNSAVRRLKRVLGNNPNTNLKGEIKMTDNLKNNLTWETIQENGESQKNSQENLQKVLDIFRNI